MAVLLTGTAKANVSVRVSLEDVIGRRNLVVTDPQTEERVFLHVRPGCGEMAKGQSVNLIIEGSLNGNSDSLKTTPNQQCLIDQVEPFTQKLYVRQFTLGNTEILATDEAGQDYLIGYNELCQAMPQFRDSWIFVLQGGSTLDKGDKLYLPDRAGACSIDRLEKITNSRSNTTPDASDRQLPSGVTGLKAILGNGKITLTWKAAQDDHGISHYLVSHSPYSIDPKKIATVDMPNLTVTNLTQLKITGLENGQRYYFYVAAVDTNGNRSSDWASALATPSDFMTGETQSPDLNLKVYLETPISFLLRWDRIPGTTRTTIAFDVDGQRIFSNTDYRAKILQIKKSADRKGKTLTLTVRTSGLNGPIKEEKIEFKF